MASLILEELISVENGTFLSIHTHHTSTHTHTHKHPCQGQGENENYLSLLSFWVDKLNSNLGGLEQEVPVQKVCIQAETETT